MAKYRALLAGIFFLTLLSPGWAYEWTLEPIPVPLGANPSLALLGNILPVVSNLDTVLGRSPGAWQTLPGYSGWIAANGGMTLVSNNQPVKFARDGSFYSSVAQGNALAAAVYQNNAWCPIAPSLPLANGFGIASADPLGRPFLGVGTFLADSWLGTRHETSFALQITDLAVSPYGDLAVSGVSNCQTKVMWFNYKLGRWCEHTLAVFSTAPAGKIAVEFDALGNLFAAYVNPARELRLACLEMSGDFWTDVSVTTLPQQAPLLTGTALAFDRLNRPVIAAGCILAYNPFSFLPGDANLDNRVDVSDLGILAANYGRTDAFLTTGDFNSDGKVDVSDLGILAANYGTGTNGGLSFSKDARALGLTTGDEAEKEDTAMSDLGLCGTAGLPLVIGIFLAGMWLGNFR